MKAWSISALTAFETCPKRYYNVSIAKKYKEAPNEAGDWGQAVHKAFEAYLKSKKPFPMGMQKLEAMAKRFGDAGTQSIDELVEKKIALNQNLEPVGYFDKDVWVRSVVDYGIVNYPKVLILDWKTGKRKSNPDQLALMAACTFALDNRITQVDSTFVWLQEPVGQQMEKVTYTSDQVGEIWNGFLPRVNEFQDAFKRDEFPAKPSGLCRRYCPVASCPHHGT